MPDPTERGGFVGWIRRHWVALAVAGVALVFLASVGAVLKTIEDNHNEDVRREQAREAALEAKARAKAREERAAAEAEADRVSLERSLRRMLVRDLRQAVRADANESIDAGLLDPPRARTASCDPVDKDPIGDLAVNVARYDCLAINEDTSDGGYRGYRYSGSINFKTGTYRWRLGGGGL